MADTEITVLDKKTAEPGHLHRLAVFGSAFAKEVGAGTLAIPGYLGDLANLTFRGKASSYGETMKQGIVNGVSWAGEKVGIEGPEILDETDQGLSLWGERVGVGTSILTGAAGVARGGVMLATKAGVKLMAKEADDVAKAAAKAAGSGADDAAKATAKAAGASGDDAAKAASKAADDATGSATNTDKAAKTERMTTDEIRKENAAKYSKMDNTVRLKMANFADDMARVAWNNYGALGTPIWVEGKYAAQWLAHPLRTFFGHAALGAADAHYTDGWGVQRLLEGISFTGKAAIAGASHINPEIPVKIKDVKDAALDAYQVIKEDVKKEADKAIETISRETGVAPQVVREGLEEAADSIPLVAVPGGPASKTVMRVLRNRDSIKDFQTARGSELPATDDEDNEGASERREIIPSGQIVTAGVLPSIDQETIGKGIASVKGFANAAKGKAGELKDKAKDTVQDFAEDGFMKMLGLDKLDKSMLLPMGIVAIGALVGGMSSDDGNKILGSLLGAVLTIMAMTFLMPKGMLGNENEQQLADNKPSSPGMQLQPG